MSRINTENRAWRLLREQGVTEPPVAVSELAESIGATVIEKDLDPDTSGVLVRRPDGQVFILVNRSHHPNRKRFSVAHEIGHHQMHGDHPAVFVDGSMIDFRDEHSASGEDWREIQANRFAAALLMPKPFLMRALAGRNIDMLNDDDELLDELARAFGVSRQAMTYRLMNLGLLRGW